MGHHNDGYISNLINSPMISILFQGQLQLVVRKSTIKSNVDKEDTNHCTIQVITEMVHTVLSVAQRFFASRSSNNGRRSTRTNRLTVMIQTFVNLSAK